MNSTVQEPLDIDYKQGDIIFHKGDDSQEMYIVQRGVVEIILDENDESSVVEIARGDFFGEMSLLESLPRTGTAKAKTDVKLLQLSRGGFMQLLRMDPSFALDMIKVLSSRIRSLDEKMYTQ